MWTFGDWTEAQRLLKVSCLIYTHFHGGWEAITSTRYSRLTNYTPDLMLFLTAWSRLFNSTLPQESLCSWCFAKSHFLPRGRLNILKEEVSCVMTVDGSKVKRVKPQEAAAGASVFLICTCGQLSRWELPTPCSTLFFSGFIPFTPLHTWPDCLPSFSPLFLPPPRPDSLFLLHFPLPLFCHRVLLSLSLSHRLLQASSFLWGAVLLFSESDSFPAALTSPHPFSSLRSLHSHWVFFFFLRVSRSTIAVCFSPSPHSYLTFFYPSL